MHSETKSNEKRNLLHIQASSPEQASLVAAAQNQCLPCPLAASPAQGQQRHSSYLSYLFSQTLTNTNTLTVNPSYPAFY